MLSLTGFAESLCVLCRLSRNVVYNYAISNFFHDADLPVFDLSAVYHCCRSAVPYRGGYRISERGGGSR